jgi:hypothetical protein
MTIGLCLALGQHNAFAQTAIDNALRAQERAVREAQQRQLPAADVFIKEEAPSGAAPRVDTDEKCFGSMRIELVGHLASMGPEPQDIVQVSCPSVRNTFGVEFQPLFFQRSASRGWSLIGLRHFFDCAVPAFCTKAATRAGIAPAPCGQCCWR